MQTMSIDGITLYHGKRHKKGEIMFPVNNSTGHSKKTFYQPTSFPGLAENSLSIKCSLGKKSLIIFQDFSFLVGKDNN